MAGKKINPWLKLGLELGPVIAFFVAFVRLKDQTVTIGGTDYGGFIIATAGFVPLLVLSTLILWRLTGKLSAMQIATLVLVVVFGGLSVWFNDERFFKMKPTLIYLIFAGVLGWGLMKGKSYLALVLQDAMPLEHEGWMILTRRLTVFFLSLAVLNEVIWRTMSDQAWVNFKTFGLTAAIFLFFMAQGRVFRDYEIEEKDS
ncbi:inner membrane-spanning protein YciB [Defluviimonas aestuarii]|uniref:inner membrane-spanning protein YciB n=1 Tax=Albidovulum aestuarii TaxID=1130726 RepID=UPI00249B7CEB|nr:inner membrane-spanning protein YciB [Defluviimonas aestuarii]MDI3335373.1 inner membrane-spanning protein YciB [Defluviimonas aestuarii]